MEKTHVYRSHIPEAHRTYFRVGVQQTDLFIHAPERLQPTARELVLRHRGYLEGYIRQDPAFASTLRPWPTDLFAPPIVREMIAAGQQAGIGPMGAVAGAISQAVGQGLLEQTPELIVENGGDIFFKSRSPLTVAIYAGRSPLSMKLGVRVDGNGQAAGLCTSSGTVGHSLSQGRADAVAVLSPSCPLADAVATAAGNQVRDGADIGKALEFVRDIPGVQGGVVIMGERIGAWGAVELVPLSGKNA